MKRRRNTGVILNAYPDSVGSRLSDMAALLQRPELRGCFRSIRSQLAMGENVLFSGTPCQADGLKAKYDEAKRIAEEDAARIAAKRARRKNRKSEAGSQQS